MNTTENAFGLFLPCPACGETHAGYVKSPYGIDRKWDCGRIESWDSTGQRWILTKDCQTKTARKKAQNAVH